MYLNRLEELRTDRDLKQYYIAKLLNISQQHYSMYELGKREIPLKKLVKLADYYNVSLDYICNRTNKREVNK